VRDLLSSLDMADEAPLDPDDEENDDENEALNELAPQPDDSLRGLRRRLAGQALAHHQGDGILASTRRSPTGPTRRWKMPSP
jgi:hypothetical protein